MNGINSNLIEVPIREWVFLLSNIILLISLLNFIKLTPKQENQTTFFRYHQLDVAQGAGFFKIFNASARSSGVAIFGFLLTNFLPSQKFLALSLVAFICGTVILGFKVFIKKD